MTCLAQEEGCWVRLPPDLVEGTGVSVDAVALERWLSCGESISVVWVGGQGLSGLPWDNG